MGLFKKQVKINIALEAAGRLVYIPTVTLGSRDIKPLIVGDQKILLEEVGNGVVRFTDAQNRKHIVNVNKAYRAPWGTGVIRVSTKRLSRLNREMLLECFVAFVLVQVAFFVSNYFGVFGPQDNATANRAVISNTHSFQKSIVTPSTRETGQDRGAEPKKSIAPKVKPRRAVPIKEPKPMVAKKIIREILPDKNKDSEVNIKKPTKEPLREVVAEKRMKPTVNLKGKLKSKVERSLASKNSRKMEELKAQKLQKAQLAAIEAEKKRQQNKIALLIKKKNERKKEELAQAKRVEEKRRQDLEEKLEKEKKARLAKIEELKIQAAEKKRILRRKREEARLQARIQARNLAKKKERAERRLSSTSTSKDDELDDKERASRAAKLISRLPGR